MAAATPMEASVADVLSTGLEDAHGELLVVNPSQNTIRDLVTVLETDDHGPTVSLLSAEDPVKELMEDFLVASLAADLVEAGVLEIRTLESPPRNSLLVSESSVVAIVNGGDAVAGLTTSDDAFVTAVAEHYWSRWNDASPFSLRAPALSRVQDTLMTQLGEQTAADFDAALDALEVVSDDGVGLDEVTISLLVAARNGDLLYDISKWGEDVGLASKATFSRTKTRLEDQGLIETEKVPIDVGRPRLRLIPGDDRLADGDIHTMTEVARRLLAV